jgi:putative Mg2+ transporter-C (MgtC) family protein
VILQPEDVLKLALAILAGGLIGMEREYRDKAAGFRTLIFICTGATLFTILAGKMDPNGDPTRMAANIISGVGFLGAGVILRDAGRVVGLTTAAAIWLTAALGVGIGGGQYLVVITTEALMLGVLWIFPLFERGFRRSQNERVYEIVSTVDPDKLIQLRAVIEECGLRLRSRKEGKSTEGMVSTWETSGLEQNHSQLVARLLADPAVKDFHY